MPLSSRVIAAQMMDMLIDTDGSGQWVIILEINRKTAALRSSDRNDDWFAGPFPGSFSSHHRAPADGSICSSNQHGIILVSRV
jgi:hypothetical protein